MRPGLRGIVGLPDAHGDAAAVAARDNRCMAVGVHCQRQRTWRSIFLVGSNAKVIAPSIIDAWLSSSSTLSSALALIQSAAVFIALTIMLQAARRYSRELP